MKVSYPTHMRRREGEHTKSRQEQTTDESSSWWISQNDGDNNFTRRYHIKIIISNVSDCSENIYKWGNNLIPRLSLFVFSSLFCDSTLALVFFSDTSNVSNLCLHHFKALQRIPVPSGETDGYLETCGRRTRPNATVTKTALHDE